MPPFDTLLPFSPQAAYEEWIFKVWGKIKISRIPRNLLSFFHLLEPVDSALQTVCRARRQRKFSGKNNFSASSPGTFLRPSTMIQSEEPGHGQSCDELN